MTYSFDLGKAKIAYDPLEDDQLNMLAEWGMSLEAKRFRATVPGEIMGAAFKGFTVEFFGIIDDSIQVPSKDFVNTIEICRPNGVIEKGQVWRRRVYSENTKAYIEALWHPKGKTLIYITDIQRIPLSQQVVEIKKLAEGLPLTLGTVKPGRERIKNPEQVFYEAVEHYREFLATTGKHPKAIQIAKACGRSKTRFYQDLKDCGRSFQLVRDLAKK